ncbi:hypothetical protein ACFYZB_39555 [Streptomyces sp. NPDC001852]|uniref:hypothetical protein n=1 Tax=Streptomyces sp. NPDC001852 TaxID=3364619 RepID=UPI003699AA09
MTAERGPVVEHRTLALGRRLGQGGQGTVYQVNNKKINEADGGGWEVAYKEYDAGVLPDLDAAALAAQVSLLGELGAAEGRWLCDRTAWPAAVVEREGQACGFLMRAVPDRFRFAFRSLSGTSAERRLANLEFLLNSDAYVASIGLRISERDRLEILADLAATLGRLHRIGIAVGDLSPKNLLFTTDPRPACFLIDCDAMRLRGATVLPQAETPDWQIPAGEEKATPAGDVYKFALLAVRLFARDQSATDPAALTALSPELGGLARGSLDPDPARRPTPAAWAEQLGAAASTASTAPAKAPTKAPGAGSRSRAGSGSGSGSGSGGSRPGAGRPAAMAVAAVAALVVIIVAFVATHSGGGAGSASDGSVQSSISSSYDFSSTDDSGGSGSSSGGTSSGSDTSSSDSGGATTPTDPGTTPPSAEDQAFSAVSTGDCLSNSYDFDGMEWSPSTPTTSSCSDAGAYYRVTSLQGGCSSGAMTWYHSNSDGTDTDFCLNRNFVVGQCMFAHANGNKLSIYFNAATPCGAGIPDKYQYTVELTQVYPGGAPADACGSQWQWTYDDGTVTCGKAIWKRHGLPDM